MAGVVMLPNLSEWHLVPTGAVIEPGTPFAVRYESGRVYYLPDGVGDPITQTPGGLERYTPIPLTPSLPTEPGTVIYNVTTTHGHHFDAAVRRKGDHWAWLVFNYASFQMTPMWVSDQEITGFSLDK